MLDKEVLFALKLITTKQSKPHFEMNSGKKFFRNQESQFQ